MKQATLADAGYVVGLTIWFSIFILIIIININLIWVGLFGQFGQFTPRGVAPAQSNTRCDELGQVAQQKLFG